MYTIAIDYQTGDSFHTEDVQGEEIGCAWESKELAQKALQAIKEHHEIFDSSLENKTRRKKAKKHAWYAAKFPEYALYLEVDDGSKVKISTFWEGYFEQLHGAEIVSDSTKDKFTTN